MKSIKYQLLEADYDFVCKQLSEYREIIEQQREENRKLNLEIKIYKRLYELKS
jgi:hypothetical protein